jgi:hypothetical protein
MNDISNIEQLIRDSYLNGRAPVPEHLWKMLRYRLFLLNFIRGSLKWLILIPLFFIALFLIRENQLEVSIVGQNETHENTEVMVQKTEQTHKAIISETSTNLVNEAGGLKPRIKIMPLNALKLQNTEDDLQEPAGRPSQTNRIKLSILLPSISSGLTYIRDARLTYPSIQNKMASFIPDSVLSVGTISELVPIVVTQYVDTTEDIFKQPGLLQKEGSAKNLNPKQAAYIQAANPNMLGKELKTPSTSKHGAIQHSISVSLGSYYGFTKMSSAAGYQDHINYRKSQESLGSGHEIGIEWVAAINNFTLTSGLVYDISRRKVNYLVETPMSGPGSFYYTYDTTFAWIYDPPQIAYQIIVSIDSTFIQRMKTLQWDGWRSYSFLEIPFFAGYKGSFGKTGWETSLGIKAVFPIAVQGKLLAPDNTELWQEAAIRNTLSPVSIHFGVRCGLTRPLTAKWLLYTEMSATLRTSPYKIEFYPITEKSYMAGLKFGIRYQLSNP